MVTAKHKVVCVVVSLMLIMLGMFIGSMQVGETHASVGALNTLTVINNDTTDGYVRLTGLLQTKGNKEIIVDGVKYVFKVIEEPNSSNVNAVIN